MARISPSYLSRYANNLIKYPTVRSKVDSLSDYLAILDNVLDQKNIYWFRGHSKISHRLIPTALRYKSKKDRTSAINLLPAFRRVAQLKQQRPPDLNDVLGWMQIAQHYGLPTQLLDWSENPLTALYFACSNPAEDGIVITVSPSIMNKINIPKSKVSAILDPHDDKNLIDRYFSHTSRKKLLPVAINPIWNSERILIQKGGFSLHHLNNIEILPKTPSLIGIPIPRESKPTLIQHLRKVGVDEMTLFPELEHAAIDIQRSFGLLEAPQL